MTTESQQLDPYEAVLHDLRAKRAQLDQAIQTIETIRSSGLVVPAVASAAGVGTAGAVGSTVEGPSDLLGMTIPEAAKKVLAARRKALGNAEIVAAFKAGGMHMNSVDPINTVGSVLTRRFSVVGDIVKVGRGVWGLAEWYPNRTFKKPGQKGDGNGEKPDAESKTTETT